MACFIAGTYVLALDGFKRIEDIVAGDKIMAADPDTFEIAEKTVLETYVRQVDKLVHITINGEEIVTTDNHPFYVQGRGFIEAGNLLIGDKLVSSIGEDLLIENYNIEETENLVDVYNFQVEDFHTYFVGDCAVWVHNDCNFSQKAMEHMNEDGRKLPVMILEEAIEVGEALPDPRGSSATMYYTQMTKSGKLYNLEVLYDSSNNTIYHFEYTRKAIGNLPAIKK